MHLNRRIWIQLVIFIVVALIAASVMVFGYIKAPATLFGVGQYTVTVELPQSGNLYQEANVTYRGTEVGLVHAVHLTDTGVEAELALNKGIDIPSDLDAQVHSQTALGEQYVDLLPRNGDSPPLKNGDVIPRDRTSIPPDTTLLLDSINRGLKSIPQDNLKTVIDESYTAIGGLGPEISRIVKGSTQLAIDARKNLDPLVTLIDQSKPVLDSQVESSDAIQSWAANLKTVTGELRTHDDSVTAFLQNGPPAADQARELIDRLQPTLPVILANLVSVGDVAVTYQPDIEQLLVLLPQGVAALQAGMVAGQNTKQAYKGAYLDFNLNFNLPPPCTTGFLPIQQQRTANFEDYPNRPAGDLYCRVPQDSPFNVRGARNYPCETVPGKRAPTVKMCESNENYVPLNDGFNWKGDPNATLSGQDIPQLAPGTPPAQNAPPPGPAPPPLAAAQYDPATGSYVGPDGKVYTQANLAKTAPEEQTWQSMLTPPTGN
jgi:phospholipid/cholesterol/gamma-HCH transport system substrate-binding protein